jgi:hypothetical protein
MFDHFSHIWLNRDPLGEKGDLNLYCFAYNCGENLVDTDGRDVLNPTFPIGGLPIVEWPVLGLYGAAFGIGVGLGYGLAQCANAMCSAPPSNPPTPVGPTYPGSGGGNTPPSSICVALPQATPSPIPITLLPIIPISLNPVLNSTNIIDINVVRQIDQLYQDIAKWQNKQNDPKTPLAERVIIAQLINQLREQINQLSGN